MSAERRPTRDRVVAERLAQLTQRTARATPMPPPAPLAALPATRSTARIAELCDLDGVPIATLACDVELGAVVLGRGRLARVRIADARVSRAHASLTWEPSLGAHVLRDLDSANGTFVDGRRVAQAVTLYDGARLEMGDTQLRYCLAGVTGPADVPTAGQRLRAARTARGLTLAELARRTGVSVGTLERAERDLPPALTAQQTGVLARAVGVEPASLLPSVTAPRRMA